MSQPGSPAGAGGTQGEEMLLRLLQGQQEQLQRLQEMMGAQLHGQQQLAAATQNIASSAQGASRPRGLIDVKAVGRPNSLGGSLEEASRNWRQWNYRLELWLASQFPEARKILSWAREKGDSEIPLASLESASIPGVSKEAVLEFNRQLEVVLGTLTNEAPGDITMNSSTGSGLDMYRRLHVRLDPADMVTSMRWLRTLMSTQPVDSITDLVPAIEKWEDAHRRYSQRKDCSALTEQQKMVSLLGLAPSELQGHLELNLGRLTSYELLRREMVSFADTKRAFTATDGAVPMEVDALKGAKGPKGKGKKGESHQGKGGKKEDRECFICSKKGHLARDCWHKDKGKGRGTDGAKLKAQGKKGSKGRQGRAHELEGAEGEAMEDGDHAYEAGEPDEEAELGFVGALEGEGSAEDEKEKKDDDEEGTGGDGAHRSSPGVGSSTDRPEAKAKAGSASSTQVGLRMANTSVLNKLQERRRELEESLQREQDKGDEAEPGEISKLKLMLDQVRDQIKRAQELQRNRTAGMSARLKADLRAGYNARLAKKKDKSRQRAAAHRQSLRRSQAISRISRAEALEKRFNVPGKGRKQEEYPLMPEKGSKVAAPPSRREKAMMKGNPEEREHSDDDLDVPRERDWTVRPVKMTPEGREGKKRREARRKARRNREMREERESGASASAASGSAASASAREQDALMQQRANDLLKLQRAAAQRRKSQVEPKGPPPGTARPNEPKGPPPKPKAKPVPGPRTPPRDEEELVEAVFTFKDNTGATVRSRIRELTGLQREKVQRAIASAPWRLDPEAKVQPGRPTVNKRSQLFSRAVNYLKGHRPEVSESKVRRKGLAKQYKKAPRFRQRVGIRQRMLALGPRGTAGEQLTRTALDEESDCGSCHSRRVKSTLPADLYYKKRKAARAKQRAKELLSEDEKEDEPQRGYDTDPDPGHKPLGRGPRSPPGGGEGAKEAVVYSFETGVGGAASEATMEVILDSGASHNVVPKEWVKHLEWGPAEGPAGFRTADGSWLPNLGTAVVSLKSAEGFSFKVRFSVASVKRALLSATQVLKLGHTILLKGSKATIYVKGDRDKALTFKVNGSPKATFALKGFLRHCRKARL